MLKQLRLKILLLKVMCLKKKKENLWSQTLEKYNAYSSGKLNIESYRNSFSIQLKNKMRKTKNACNFLAHLMWASLRCAATDCFDLNILKYNDFSFFE